MKTKNRIVFFVLFIGIAVQAQVSNTGTMVISPNTVMGVVSGFDNKEQGLLLNDGEMYLFSDFNNDGITAFTPSGQGNVRFEGAARQKITGEFPAEFKNILINNASAQPAIALHSEISVAGDASFNQGIISDESSAGMMIFEKEATHSNASHKSHVDATVMRHGDREFVYPVGHKGFYRHSKIEATKDALSSFMGRYLYENSDDLFPHFNKAGVIEIINDKEYWVLEKMNGTADAILTLSWDEETTTPQNIVISPEEDIHIVGWDPAEKLWKDKGGIVDAAAKTVTTAISVGEHSVFTLARIKSDKIIKPCANLVIYNAVSPNGDGVNDYFRIDGLDACSKGENTVQIYNRWGVKVFETRNYGANGNVFKGYSEGRATLSAGNVLLPVGTYFYVLKLEYREKDNTSGTISKAGYLYLN